LGCGIYPALENLRFHKTFKSRVQQATQGFRSGTNYQNEAGRMNSPWPLLRISIEGISKNLRLPKTSESLTRQDVWNFRSNTTYLLLSK
jgi:hypothetical protein